MLVLSLSLLLAAWTTSAVRYAAAIRNAEPQFPSIETVEPSTHPLAA